MKVAELLLGRGDDVNYKGDGYCLTALSWASLNGHAYVNVVELLLGQGAEVDKADRGGGSALHNAALKGHTQVIELLLGCGADVNKAHEDGRIALIYVCASARGCTEDVELLLRSGADINKATTHGANALSSAVEYCHKASALPQGIGTPR